MKNSFPLKFNLKNMLLLLMLAIPLILSNLIESSIGFFSTLFLSRLGTNAVAAGALVSAFFSTLMVVLWGLLTSISTLVSHKYGEKDHQSISFILRDALILAFILILPAFTLLWHVAPLLKWVGQSSENIQLANACLHGMAFGLLPDFVCLILLQFLVGLGHARTSMFFTLLWVPITVLSNYALIFGQWGLPALGIAGIGYGTSLGFWITAVILLLYIFIHKDYKPYLIHMFLISKPLYIKDILQVGLPMGVMYCFEVGFFFVLTLSMGKLGTQQLAANQITLQYLGPFSSITFAFAQAITVKMGHQLGEKNAPAAEQTAYSGLILASIFMLCVALCYWLIPDVFIAIDFNLHDPDNHALIHYATSFLAMCAIFQIIEAIRLVLFGALRSLKDTHFSLITSIIGFWLLGLPIGYFLTFHLNVGGKGLWLGMIIGAIANTIMLYWRFSLKMHRFTRYCPKLPELSKIHSQ